jgi:hypothetical protein
MSTSGLRNSELRDFLLRFAAREKLRIHEHFSDTYWYCHLEGDRGSATSVSRESADNALVMAFLSFENSDYNFLD